MSRAALLVRIRKCLALAKSANEHEAAAALATARRLMDEYGVDEAETATLDVGEANSKGSGNGTPSAWEAELVWTVARAIPVQLHYTHDRWTFVGLTPAPEIASYAFVALFRQLKRARTDYIRVALKRVVNPRRKTRRADAYCEGWANAVYNKIARLYPAQPTDPLVTAYLARRYPNLSTFTPRETALTAANDRGRGWNAGRQVELNQGVTGGGQRLLA